MTLKIGNRGFTLIEIMITIVVLTIGTVGVLSAYMTLINAFELSRSSTDVYYLLKEKISDVEKDVAEKKEYLPGIYEGKFEDRGEDFSWKLEVQDKDLGDEDLKNVLDEITVTVYDNRIKPQTAISLTTYVNNNALQQK